MEEKKSPNFHIKHKRKRSLEGTDNDFKFKKRQEEGGARGRNCRRLVHESDGNEIPEKTIASKKSFKNIPPSANEVKLSLVQKESYTDSESFLNEQKCERRVGRNIQNYQTDTVKRNICKSTRHREEKEEKESLHCAGATVGENVGNGQMVGKCSDSNGKPDEENEADGTLDHHEVNRNSSNNAHPLLLFFDLETTGLNVYDEQITEIAAKVVGVPDLSIFSQPIFSSLVKTTKDIPPYVSDLTGITADLIRSEKPLSKVLPEFFKWIDKSTQECSVASGCDYYPVLVAHSGYRFDFPILLAEIERQAEKSALSQMFRHHRIHFADTYLHLKTAKQNGHSALASVTKISLEHLHNHFFGEEQYSAHRALPDVEAMEKIMTEPRLNDLLSSLPIRRPTEQLEAWANQRNTYNIRTSLGRCISRDQAKRLNALNLTYEALQDLRSSCNDCEEFGVALLKAGVKGKSLQDKLKNLVKPRH